MQASHQLILQRCINCLDLISGKGILQANYEQRGMQIEAIAE
jgi:hypothetical protein